MECGTGILLFCWTLAEKHIGKLSTVKHKLVLVIAAVEVLELLGENKVKQNRQDWNQRQYLIEKRNLMNKHYKSTIFSLLQTNY